MIGGTFLPQTGELFWVEPEAEFSVGSCACAAEEGTGDNGKALLLLTLGFAAFSCGADPVTAEEEPPPDLFCCDFDGASKEI